MRSRESVELDVATPVAPFIRWDRFMAQFRWNLGAHVTTIGPTGSGKTVLNRALLARRQKVIVLGVKNRDPELYGPFQAQGYELVHRFEVPDEDDPPVRVLFVPLAPGYHGRELRERKARAFRAVLNQLFDRGLYTVYCDDVQYLSDQLRLRDELEELWMIGRSEDVTVVASSQEPVNIPVMAYGAATHLFLFSNKDRYRARRMAELTGVNRDQAEAIILGLPPHEFLYINRETSAMIRSKVLR